MPEITGDNVSLESLKPRDIAQVIQWSTKTRDSYFLMHSILPVNSEDIAMELGSPSVQLFMIRDRQDKPSGLIKTYGISILAGRGMLSFTLQPSNNNTKL